jgi:hypothetical protein
LDVKTKTSGDIPFSVESPPPTSAPSAAPQNAPSLQGATNGTIGPAAGSFDKERSSTSIIGKSLRMEGRYNTSPNADAQKVIAPMQGESGLSSWLPRGGVNRQVMESRAPQYQAQTSAPSNGLVGAPVDPRYGQSNEVAVDSNKNGFLDTESPFMRSLAIFVLVFLSGHAFFKLLRAILRSRSN